MNAKGHFLVFPLLAITLTFFIIAFIYAYRLSPKQTEKNFPGEIQSPKSENIKEFRDGELTFYYPADLEYSSSEDKRKHTWFPMTPSSFFIILEISDKPFAEKPTIDSLLDLKESTSPIQIESDTQITISERPMREIVFACGLHCYFSEKRFQANDKYYKLTASIAGGGLARKFDIITNTITFKP